MKKVVSLTRRAIEQYNMIEDGDKIAVGVSGGKDSLVLLNVLAELSRYYPKKFTVMGLTLDMSPRALEEVIYFAAYVVIDPKETPLERKSLLTEREYREKLQEYGHGSFVAKMGAEAIQDLLKQVDLEAEIA